MRQSAEDVERDFELLNATRSHDTNTLSRESGARVFMAIMIWVVGRCAVQRANEVSLTNYASSVTQQMNILAIQRVTAQAK